VGALRIKRKTPLGKKSDRWGRGNGFQKEDNGRDRLIGFEKKKNRKVWGVGVGWGWGGGVVVVVWVLGGLVGGVVQRVEGVLPRIVQDGTRRRPVSQELIHRAGESGGKSSRRANRRRG